MKPRTRSIAEADQSRGEAEQDGPKHSPPPAKMGKRSRGRAKSREEQKQIRIYGVRTEVVRKGCARSAQEPSTLNKIIEIIGNTAEGYSDNLPRKNPKEYVY